MRYLFAFLVLYSIFGIRFCYSQPEFSFSAFSFLSGDSSKISIAIYGDAFLNSSTVNNSFFHQFNKNGYISDDIRNEISGNLREKNHIGADANYGISYNQKINSRWQYTILVADKVHINAGFPGDLFDLAFYGNKKFEGDTAVLDNTDIRFLRYQQIQAGLIRTSESRNRYGIGVSFLKGEENYDIELHRARLITAGNGESLDADLNIEINHTDTANKGMDAFHGWGVSSDLFAEFPFEIKGYKSLFRTEVNDLGFLQWNSNSFSYKADTSIHFEGVVVSDIFQLNDSVLKTISADSLSDDLQSSVTRKEYTSYLPALLKLMWMLEVEKFIFSAGIMHRLNANYKPFTYLKTSYRFSPVFSAGSKISYGGYGKIGMGVEIGLTIKNFVLLAGSNNIEGFILPKYSGGNSGFISLRKEF